MSWICRPDPRRIEFCERAGLTAGPSSLAKHVHVQVIENWYAWQFILTANPQLNAATYIGNLGRSNYHALQVSYTLRPTNGFSAQTKSRRAVGHNALPLS